MISYIMFKFWLEIPFSLLESLSSVAFLSLPSEI